MKIAFESELMANQKHAVVMAPDLAFEVLQSQDGAALFLSIGTDNIFYLTREVTETSTGWNKIDLSSALSSQHGGSPVAAQAFSAAQNAQTLGIDLALVVTVDGSDFLYLSLGNANTDDAWAHGVTWTLIPFDAGTAPSPLAIADALIMNIPAASGSAAVENIFVDILRTPGDPSKLLDRYYIVPGGTPQWNLHELAADLAAGSISSCLGQRTKDPIPGIYTFGTISGEQELIFTPQYNYWNPTVPPSPARLTLPAGASAIASALNGSGVSNLFVAGTDGLFLFTPDNQGDQATPVQIVSNSLVAGASALAAATDANQTAVWGVDPQGNLFYVMCPAGSEADPTAWSTPVPLLPGVEGFAFFLNLGAGNNILFAHVDGPNLVQLTQDPVTTDWQQRSILLSSTSPNDMAEYNSFTTHIQVTDDNGVGAPNTPVAITATGRASVYINNVYYLLSPTVPVNTIADANGTVTVMQETHSLSAVCFRLELTGTSSVVAEINPMSKVLATLGTIQSGDDLGTVQVTNADGTQQPLVPPSVSSADKDSAAKSLAQFVQIANELPQDGSRQAATVSAPRMAAAATAPRSWGVSFANGAFQYYEGEDAARRLGLHVAGPALAAGARVSSIGGVGSNIEVAAGDFFRWLKNAYDEVTSFVVQEAEGVYHFIAQIGDVVYDALLDCVSSVVHAVEFVFNRIQVFFNDLIKWLGFLFEWGDILNTHNVLKNVFKLCAARAVNRIVNLENDVESAFEGIESRVNTWAGIPNSTTLIGSDESTSSGTPGQGSPQSNWALYHTKGNLSAATTPYSTPSINLSPLEQIFNDLKTVIDAEINTLKTAIEQLKTEVIDPFATLTATEAIQKIAAIITDAILSTAGNIIVTALDIVRAAIDGILGLLDAPISIPILSPIYHKITGNDLSFLDLTSLIVAIPATVIYKAMAGQAPFSDSDAQALSSAQDYATLQALLTGSSAPAASSTTALASAEPPSSTDQLLNELSKVSNVAACFGAIGVVFTAALKNGFSQLQENPPRELRYTSAVLYLAFVAPNYVQVFRGPGEWFTVTNDVVTTIAIGKTLADNTDTLSAMAPWSDYISPVAESLINLVWLIPAVGIVSASSLLTSDWRSFAGNIAFDMGGVITPASATQIDPDPPVAKGFFVATQLLNLAYGILCLGTASALSKGD